MEVIWKCLQEDYGILLDSIGIQVQGSFGLLRMERMEWVTMNQMTYSIALLSRELTLDSLIVISEYVQTLL